MGAVWLVAQTKAFDRLAVLKEVVEYFDPANAQERQRAAERFEAEARTLGELKHPGIPDLYAYFSEGGHNYLVMEYIEGPDMRTYLTREDESTGQLVPGKRLVVDEVLDCTTQICSVLEYLAARQPPVIHNDIKPGNIIIDENSGRAVLVDFGTAKTKYLRASGGPDRKKDSIYGTVGYAAPELYRGHSESRSDVYSLAATAYHLLTDDDPRDHPGQYPKLGDLAPGLATILGSALADQVDDRPTAAEFRQQLEGYLAGQGAPLRALTFPNGDAADDRDELLALSVKHWHYASGILQDGTMAHWLRRRLHDPVAAKAAEQALGQWPNDPDAALDAFVQALNPALLPPGVLDLRTSSIQLSGLGEGQRLVQQIEIANKGRGYVRGEILSTQPWVRVGKVLSCPPGQSRQIPIEIDTAGLAPGVPYLAAVTLSPASGPPEVVAIQIVLSQKPAPAQSAVSAPAIEVSPDRLDFGAVVPGVLSTPRLSVSVKNVSQKVAQVGVKGAPPWLLVKPKSFRLKPGAEQVVSLVGRVEKVRGRRHAFPLLFALDGGRNQQVEIRLQIKRRGLFG
jgi:serine/threonine-protein kinase